MGDIMAKYTAEEAKELVKKGVYSDTEKLEKMTEEDIHEAALSDLDAQPLTEEQAKEFKPAVQREKGIYAHEKKTNNNKEENE